MANKEVAEDYEGIRLIRTNGIDDVIRCVLCTNVGCEGACQVNEHLYDEVMNAIHFLIMEEDEVNEYLSSKHDREVIRKFAEWLAENVGFECTDCVRCFKCTEGSCINNLLYEYEKIQKGEQNAFVKTINLETAKNILADRYIVDTSEHNAQVMAAERQKVLDEVIEKIKNGEYCNCSMCKHYYEISDHFVDGDCTRECEDPIVEMVEQMKGAST